MRKWGIDGDIPIIAVTVWVVWTDRHVLIVDDQSALRAPATFERNPQMSLKGPKDTSVLPDWLRALCS